MKVSDLILLLQRVSPDLDVVIRCDGIECEYESVRAAEHKTVVQTAPGQYDHDYHCDRTSPTTPVLQLKY